MFHDGINMAGDKDPSNRGELDADSKQLVRDVLGRVATGDEIIAFLNEDPTDEDITTLRARLAVLREIADTLNLED